MLKNIHQQTIFAIAFCKICEEYVIFLNERSVSLDVERKLSNHATNKHNHNREGIGWTKEEGEMAQIMRRSGFKESYL